VPGDDLDGQPYNGRRQDSGAPAYTPHWATGSCCEPLWMASASPGGDCLRQRRRIRGQR